MIVCDEILCILRIIRSVDGNLIAFNKLFIRFQNVDIIFFRERFFKTTVITASHPWLQAYEGSTGYGPDTEIREALTGKCQIWSSVREEDTGLLDLTVIKNKSVFIKHMRSNGTGSVFKGKCMWLVSNDCSRPSKARR